MIMSMNAIPTDVRLAILTWARHIASKYSVELVFEMGGGEPLGFLPSTTVKTATAIRAEYDLMTSNLNNARAWV
jgi:hypothetical protein